MPGQYCGCATPHAKRKKTVHDLELFGYSGVSVAQGRARGLCGV